MNISPNPLNIQMEYEQFNEDYETSLQPKLLWHYDFDDRTVIGKPEIEMPDFTPVKVKDKETKSLQIDITARKKNQKSTNHNLF